jgi:hypothetical protein
VNRLTFFKRFVLVGFACCVTSAIAQSTNPPTTVTNLVVAMAVNVTAYVQATNNAGQPSVTVVKLGTKDIIAAIGSDYGKSSNDLSGAKLLVVETGIGDTSVQPPVNRVLRISSADTDINANFLISPSFLPSVETLRGTSRGTKVSTIYTPTSLTLTTTNLSFEAKGRLKLDSRAAVAGKTIIDSRLLASAASMSLTGTGTVGTNNAVFIGTFTLTGPKVETRTQ